MCEVGGATKPISFTNGTWSDKAADLLIFDSDFVEKNVYSGHEVRRDQRQVLLEFALGDQAVALKKTIDDLTAQIDTATRARSDAEKDIAAFARQMPTQQFIKLVLVPDAAASRCSTEARRGCQERRDSGATQKIRCRSWAFRSIRQRLARSSAGRLPMCIKRP